MAYINVGHSFSHLVMLLFPTVVLALEPAWDADFSDLLPLGFAGYLLFGLGALPAGWLGDRWSSEMMMVIFFLGTGAACMLAGLAVGPVTINHFARPRTSGSAAAAAANTTTTAPTAKAVTRMDVPSAKATGTSASAIAAATGHSLGVFGPIIISAIKPMTAKNTGMRWVNATSDITTAAATRQRPLSMPRAASPKANKHRLRLIENANSPASVDAMLPPPEIVLVVPVFWSCLGSPVGAPLVGGVARAPLSIGGAVVCTDLGFGCRCQRFAIWHVGDSQGRGIGDFGPTLSR